jgi:hypothetical protein
MPHPTTFSQDCPTCGRRLHVRTEYVKQKVACQHCRAIFVAHPPEQTCPQNDWRTALMKRADELLAFLAVRAGFA